MNDARNNALIEIIGDNYFGYYETTRIACRGIVTRDDDILLVYEKNKDVWMIPGGGLEEGEEETACVIRELTEETGYVVEPKGFVLEIDEYYENEQYISKYYRCDILGQGAASLTKREAKAGLEPRWVPVKEAIHIFSKHKQYAKEDEMKRGLYFREHSALRRVLQGK